MTSRDDPLDLPQDPDRVFYDIGVMLDQDDFRAEQNYHRGRLARALTFLHGSGTAAGLFVRVPDPEGGGPPTPASVADEQVRVGAGIAVDAVGRLIEVPSERCIRLQRWLDAQAIGASESASAEEREQFSRIRQAFHASAEDETVGAIVLDVLLRFAACERGKTPGFATGPFDSLDAVYPSRIRDAFEIQLVPRTEDPLPVPRKQWPDLSSVNKQDSAARLHQAIFEAWNAALPSDPPDDPMVPAWLDAKGQKHWLFLARLHIPATPPTSDTDLPARIVDRPVVVDNEMRAFVYTAGALARLEKL